MTVEIYTLRDLLLILQNFSGLQFLSVTIKQLQISDEHRYVFFCSDKFCFPILIGFFSLNSTER